MKEEREIVCVCVRERERERERKMQRERERDACVNDLQCVRASCNKCEITRNVRKRLAELCGWFADDCGWFADDCGHPAKSETWNAMMFRSLLNDCGHPAESETWNAMMFRLHLMPRNTFHKTFLSARLGCDYSKTVELKYIKRGTVWELSGSEIRSYCSN